MLTEVQIRHLAATTPLWYDSIAALADRAERHGISDNLLCLVIDMANDAQEARDILEMVRQESEQAS